ncbi:MAG: hypothetical protein UR94_C0037G0002 [Parcubacteria group bacterium GW2011_GWA2_36_10]|nr:MAG: hypothetical protein UR94_C0037G0002 [Parcubacteria group bacterium GW2011_GWA2_36_10]
MKKSETILQKDVSELKTTVNDILFAVNKLSENFEQRFDNVEQRLDNVEQDLSSVKSKVNTQMVTKDYLDRKLTELRGVNKLTHLLQKKKIITPLEVKMVLSI